MQNFPAHKYFSNRIKVSRRKRFYEGLSWTGKSQKQNICCSIRNNSTVKCILSGIKSLSPLTTTRGSSLLSINIHQIFVSHTTSPISYRSWCLDFPPAEPHLLIKINVFNLELSLALCNVFFVSLSIVIAVYSLPSFICFDLCLIDYVLPHSCPVYPANRPILLLEHPLVPCVLATKHCCQWIPTPFYVTHIWEAVKREEKEPISSQKDHWFIESYQAVF